MINNTILETAVVLIVDDDPTNIGVLFNELQRFNCTVLVAQDGKTAIELAINEQPHIILLDVMMPGLNGFETCRILKQEERTAQIPVLFLSALNDPVDQVKGFDSGGVDYITKPFKSDEVMARIVTHLTLSQLGDSLKQKNEILIDEINQRIHIESELRHVALHDSLTGLPNRDALLASLQKALDNLEKGDQFALLFLDLDRFKVINDSLGHMSGDMVLRLAAYRIKQCVTEKDLVARFGGDEFAIVLNDIKSDSEVIKVADTVCVGLMRPFELESQRVFSGASMGIVFGGEDYQTPEDLLRDADVAMYQAKAEGGLNYQIFNRDMYEDAIARLQLESDIRHGITQEEFVVHYQPIVDAKTGKINGFEALMRWQHPEYGLVMPGKFLPVAEETGVIRVLGRWMIAQACQQLKVWHDAGHDHLFMAVNMSARQLSQIDLVEWMEQLLLDVKLTADVIELEITEGIITRNSKFHALEKLVDMGFNISIDDFGVGSSLECLKYFHLDTLKIDQSFVMGMMSDHRDMVIVRAITVMARSLGLKIIAEGVETIEQYQFLCEQECDEIQGFYFYPSLPAEEISLLLGESK